MLKFIQTTDRVKAAQGNLQTEELIADSRSTLTPSQRVDAKLAACSGGLYRRDLRSGLERIARRPK